MKFTLGRKNLKQTYGNVSNETKPQSAKFVDTQRKEGVNRASKTPREIISKRSRNQKVYDNNNGCITAEFHDKPIHYLDSEDNTFKDIDNSFVDTGDGFETRKNSFKTRFNKRTKNGKIFDIQKNDCKLSLISREAAQRGSCELENCTCCEEQAENTSRVMLKNVKNNVDIEYIVDSEKVKENIIIKEKSDNYDFNFDFAIENLIVSASRTGKRLELKKKVTGRPQFYIPAPFMIDADGNRSDDVYCEVEQNTKDSLSLKVIADKDWINAEGRAFPVIIDPQVVAADYYGVYYDDQGYSDSIFSYKTMQKGKTIGHELRILCADGLSANAIESTLTINKSGINPLFLANMISASLVVYVDSGKSKNSSFQIGDTVLTYGSGYKKITIDVTNILQSSNGAAVIDFRIYNRTIEDTADIYFHSPMLEIQYNNHITNLSVTHAPEKTHYWPGEVFDKKEMIVTATYENGDVISPITSFEIEPSGALATYNTGDQLGVKISFDDFSIVYRGITVEQGCLNDRRPASGRENMYKIWEVDANGAMKPGTDINFIKLSLFDGATVEECGEELSCGTPLNAINLNNLVIRAENIRGIIDDNNLPDRLKQ